MKTLFLLLCLALISMPCPCMAGASKAPAQEENSAIVAAIKRIAKGTIMKEREAENVSLLISPTKAIVSISF